jgi:hypothetical protein
MADSTLDHGKTTICMDTVYTHGRTAEGTRVTTKWTRNTATESINGLTEEDMREIGLMASNTARADIYSQI